MGELGQRQGAVVQLHDGPVSLQLVFPGLRWGAPGREPPLQRQVNVAITSDRHVGHAALQQAEQWPNARPTIWASGPFSFRTLANLRATRSAASWSRQDAMKGQRVHPAVLEIGLVTMHLLTFNN